MDNVKRCVGDGPEDAKILVLTDRPGWGDLPAERFLVDHAGKIFWDAMRSGGGILRSQVRVEGICGDDLQGRSPWELSKEEKAAYELGALERISQLKPNLILALGDWPLYLLTGKSSSDKYHLSLLESSRPGFPKVLSLLHPERCFREYSSTFYLRLGAERARREATSAALNSPARTLHIRPSQREEMPKFFNFVRDFCLRAREANWLSVDIETAHGHITCLGLGSSPHEALCIPTLPENWSSIEEWWSIWRMISDALSGSAKKVLQNGVYDLTYLASYGIRVENFTHDTMIAQRILYPELPVGLDNIARIYTEEPYWKDEGKDHKQVKDWNAYYRYNAKDVCVTLAASWAQRADLKKRGLEEFFNRMMRFASGPVLEMGWSGLPLDLAEKDLLTKLAEERVAELEKILGEISTPLLGKPVNPRSPVQVKALLAAAGFKRLPFKGGKETSDKGALMKLRLKKPDSKLLGALINISEAQKELSSYLRFEPDLARGVIPFTFYAAGTETMRSSCGKDPWNRGINAQTLPKDMKSMIRVAEDELLVEVDLAQADARVVAWDAAEPMLMKFFREKRDIHRYVASQAELFNCAEADVSHEQRQLGKKVGHAANYGVGASTLVESCLREMNLVVTERRALQMLMGYYRTFPGIQRWHRRIEEQLSRTRTLTAPTGFARSFMGRYESSMHREAYAFLPQHLVAYAINSLILRVFGSEQVLLQIHDSALFKIKAASVDKLLGIVKDQDSWNPRYKLSGGELRIPVEAKAGRSWDKMEKIYEG